MLFLQLKKTEWTACVYVREHVVIIVASTLRLFNVEQKGNPNALNYI
jgi:hypothetical protein